MQPITIPRLGWSMEEGIFGEWLKRSGETIRVGDAIFMLEGEKAASEIESLDAGILCIPDDAPGPGEKVLVGQTIGFLLDQGEPVPTSVGPTPADRTRPTRPVEPNERSKQSSAELIKTPAGTTVPRQLSTPVSAPTNATRVAGPAARRLARQLGIDPLQVNTIDPTGRVLCQDVRQASKQSRTSTTSTARSDRRIASPRARRTAQELGIDWTWLRGTGQGGRILERDVLTAAERQQVSMVPSVGIQTTIAEHKPQADGKHTPASKLRLAMAQRMQAAVNQAAPVTLSTKVLADALVALRQSWKQTAQVQDQFSLPTYGDMLIQLISKTLSEDRLLNTCWYNNGIWQYDEINIAIAVDTTSGLVAPVIRQADELSLHQISQQTRQLSEQARQGKLSQKQLEGGTFTVSNLGTLGIDAFTPLLNLPQSAILGIGRIVEEPVNRQGSVQLGHTLTLSLTFDHRVTDGAPAARWLQRLSQHILQASQFV